MKKYLIDDNGMDYNLYIDDEDTYAELRYGNNDHWTNPKGLAAKLVSTWNNFEFTKSNGEKIVIDHSDMYYLMTLAKSLGEGKPVKAVEIGEEIEI